MRREINSTPGIISPFSSVLFSRLPKEQHALPVRAPSGGNRPSIRPNRCFLDPERHAPFIPFFVGSFLPSSLSGGSARSGPGIYVFFVLDLRLPRARFSSGKKFASAAKDVAAAVAVAVALANWVTKIAPSHARTLPAITS